MTNFHVHSFPVLAPRGDVLPRSATPQDTVILIHGLFMNSHLMRVMRARLLRLGYRVVLFDHRSVRYSDATLAALHALIVSLPAGRIHLVGHSMGGLIARNYVQQHNKKNTAHPTNDSNQSQHRITSIVTLGTPHHTSRLGKVLYSSRIGRLFGSSGQSGIVEPLAPWSSQVPMGCIAGVCKMGIHHLFLAHKAPSDGTVFVDEALIENAADCLSVKASHTGLVYSAEVVAQIHSFLQHHAFCELGKNT